MQYEGETAAQLEEAALAHGYTVTEDQRARWHREGLLPRPVQRHLGRGRGTITIYPAGTEAQLVALLQLHEGKRLRIKPARWALWLAGYPVSTTYARDALRETANEWERAVSQLRDDGGDCGLSEAAWRTIEGRTDTPALRRALKRSGRKGSTSFKRLAATIAAGKFEDFMSEANELGVSDRAVFVRGMGLEEARKKTVAGVEPWLRGNLAEQLLSLQNAITPTALRDALDAATDDDLRQARDEWRTFVVGLDGARAVAEHTFRGNALGLAGAPRLVELAPDIEAVLLLGWLSFRRLPGFREGIRQVLAVLQPFAVLRHALEMSPPGSIGTTEEPPRLLEQSGGMAHGKDDSACAPTLPRPPTEPSPAP